MPSPRAVDPARTRAAVASVLPWLRGEATEPDRAVIADAVRLSARTLAAAAPGASVEVRVPPFVAVQCIAGPRHTRGTPPNVVETGPRTWLCLVVGLVSVSQAVADGTLTASGSRAGEIAEWLPLVPIAGANG